MPFEKFKPPKLHGAIGTQIGKAQGVVIAKASKAVTESTNALRAKGCPPPAELAKLDSKLSNLSTLSGTLQGNVSAFKSLPGSIKAPIQGLLAAIEVILALPVPQAIGIPPGPPGGLIFAQPTNFTTKFADLLNLLKEFAAAMLLTASAIELALQNVDSSVASISNNLKELEAPLAACKIESKLKQKLTPDQLKNLGVINEKGENVLSTFGSKVLEKENTRPAKEQLQEKLKEKLGVEQVNIKGASTLESLPKNLTAIEEGTGFRLPPVKVDGETVNSIAIVKALDEVDDNGLPKKEIVVEEVNLKPTALSGKAIALEELTNVLNKISDKISQSEEAAKSDPATSSIDGDLLKELQKDLSGLTQGLVEKENEIEDDPEYSYKGYTLRIQRTPESSILAPRHFAVAIKDGKVRIKGPNSFSASKEVLLEEIKFRIDNQLS